MRLLLAIGALSLSTCHSLAADSVSSVAEMADNAIAKGYGTECNLEYQPADNGGYYPCIDFGPYRFVREYQKVVVLVVQKDKQPFVILSGEPKEASFIYDGPWKTDLAEKMTIWWHENIEGFKVKRMEEEQSHKNRSAAAAYIDSLNKPVAEEAPVRKQPEKVTLAKTEEISFDVLELLKREAQ